MLFALLPTSCLPQRNIDSTLKKLNKNSVEYIFVDELKQTNAVLLDARKLKEFEVSHLKNALWVGYKNFEIDSVLKNYPDKKTPLIVYCSIGVRSEDIGEQLLDSGYSNVKNLYGGIFEWINRGNPVVDSNGVATKKVHAYNRYWGKLVRNGQKVY